MADTNLENSRCQRGKRTAHAGIRVAWGQFWAMAMALKRVRAMVVNFILKVV